MKSPFSPFTRRLLAAGMLAGLLGSGLAAAQPLNPPVKVRYEEVVRSILYVPKYVALSQGYFKDAGLDVSMKTSQGTDKGMTALLSGSADIVLIGPEASIYVQNSESPVKPKIFAGLTATDGFFLLSRKPIDKFDWSMVKGKEIIGFRRVQPAGLPGDRAAQARHRSAEGRQAAEPDRHSGARRRLDDRPGRVRHLP